MRKLLIAGNWKMNLVLAEAKSLTGDILSQMERFGDALDFLIIPPYTLLHPLAPAVWGTKLALGAQDLHWEPSGAFTSGISTAMLKDAGCSFVLVGHSERRDHFKDTDAALAMKLRAAIANRVTPIYCIGEHLEDREAGRTEAVLTHQFNTVLKGLAADQIQNCLLAYEPVWAIGTGKTATPEMAQETQCFIRNLLVSEFGEDTAASTRILYGGSVKPENAKELMGQPDIDGALIGGASLTADSFIGIAAAANS
jgi:triosephosphate isomerase (TIM)